MSSFLRVLAALLAAALAAGGALPAWAGGDVDGPSGARGSAAVVRGADGLRVVRLPAAATPASLQRRIGAGEQVVAFGADEPVQAFEEELPGDPLRPFQWGMDRLRAEQAWEHADAADQTIAIVDTGVDAEHPDLAGVVRAGFDAFDPEGDGRSDANGHGTHVAGIAGALIGNDIGVAGFAPEVAIMPIRALDDEGSGFSSDVAEGVIWAVDNGADIVNLSLGSANASELVQAAIAHATEHDVVVVAAAGNEAGNGNPTVYPAAYSEVIGVGASTEADERASFSGYGDWLDLVAPGSRIASTMDGSYLYSSGTSMATPFVAGTAALLRDAYPGLDAAEIREHLRSTAEDLGEEGFDEEFGHGLLDPLTALRTSPGDAPERSEEDGDAPASVRTLSDTEHPAQLAVEISREAFPERQSARRVVLSRDDAFADSLAGAALAGRRGPILLTTGGADAPLDGDTAWELRRVLRPDGTVYVLGGAQAVSERAVEQVRDELGFAVERIAGASRVETAVAVAEAVNASPSRVLLARADEWADAVTGGAFAAAAGTPVVLTPGDALHPAVAAYLADAEPREIVVLGGTAAISETVATSLAPTAVRVSGATRAGTAVALAEQLWGRTAGAAGDEFVAVDGWASSSWAPALAAAPLSAQWQAPQLLVNGRDVNAPVPGETADYLGDLGYDAGAPAAAVLVGSNAAPAEETLAALLGG